MGDVKQYKNGKANGNVLYPLGMRNPGRARYKYFQDKYIHNEKTAKVN